MSESGTVSIIVAIIGAFATILVAWIALQGKNADLSGPISSKEASSNRQSKPKLAGPIAAGVLYTIGVMYVAAAFLLVLRFKGGSYQFFICVAFALPFLAAALFIHWRLRTRSN